MSKIEVNEIDAQCGSTVTVGSAGKTVVVPGNVVKSNAVQASDGGNIVNQCGTSNTIGAAGDTVTVAGNDIRSNDYKASDGGNIINQCGTTITLGASGDTISLASGASQTGFGRTGTVDWQTSIKTSGFTAVSGEGYFCDTTSSAFTVTLPASPSAGAIVAVKDYASTFDTNNLTIGRNSSNIEGVASDRVLEDESLSITFVYADATKGWLAINDMATAQGPKFVTASGGTEATCGDFKVHRFTGPGTLTVSCAGNPLGSTEIDYLVVAGGGGGAGPTAQGTGGGAGGFRLSNATCMPAPLTSPLATPIAITAAVQSYPITVGGGGAVNNNGSNSVFSTITSAGGGGGDAGNGGSGSGGGGNGNTPPVSPPQGQNGGPGCHSGGGGAGGTGNAFSPPNIGGPGGIGSFVAAAGFAGPGEGTPGPVSSARYFAGGGGGGYPVGRPSGSPGGAGGGGTGGEGSVPATAGTANTGGGGGGASNGCGRGGGSGMVIIRYKYQ